MKRLCVLPLIFGAALVAGPPGEITGRVVDAQTGAPILRVHVRVTRLQHVQSDPVALLTGDDGSFDLTNVPAGRYALSCERTGYLRASQIVETASAAATLDTNRIPIVIRLTPQAVIEGTVVDEARVAVPFAHVQVFRRVASEGKWQVQPGLLARTDDNGKFRVYGLAAGTYCIDVTVPAEARRRTKLAYPPVFYPNSADVAGAQFVTVRPGQDQQIQIRLPEPVPAREIRGQTVPGVESAIAQIRPVDFTVPFWVSPFEYSWDQKARTFKFTGVTPGVYEIDVTAQVDGKQRRAISTVTVADRDVSGLRLEFPEQATLTGRVQVDGQGAPPHPVTRISLRSPRYQLGAEVHADGNFVFHDLLPGSYRLVISPGGGAYVRSARQGGRDVLRDGVIISSETPPAPLEITLGFPGGTVEGTVALRDGSLPERLVVALLRRDGNAMALEKQTYLTPPTAGGNAQYAFAGVAPGDYLVFAWPADAEVEYAEPEFARMYEDIGKEVTVTEGATVTVNVDRVLSPNPQ